MEEPKYETQSEIFLSAEGDAWFLRNRDHLESTKINNIDVDFICNSLFPFKGGITNILEIGCGSGTKIANLAEFFNASGFGLDPSHMAIDSAKESAKDNRPELNFAVGLATDLPYSDQIFDLVFFGFCLYLVPPSETYKTLMEADRVVKNGGFIAILDFDYGSRKVNPYRHAEGVFSYKNNYSQIFTSSGYYSLVNKWSFSHSGKYFTSDRDERISIEILHKEIL